MTDTGGTHRGGKEGGRWWWWWGQNKGCSNRRASLAAPGVRAGRRGLTLVPVLPAASHTRRAPRSPAARGNASSARARARTHAHPGPAPTCQHEHRERVKVEGEVAAHGPPRQHHHGDEEDGDLDGGAQGHRNRQVHLVLHSHKHRLRDDGAAAGEVRRRGRRKRACGMRHAACCASGGRVGARVQQQRLQLAAPGPGGCTAAANFSSGSRRRGARPRQVRAHSDVLCGVARDGQHDESQEGLVDAAALAHSLNGTRKILCSGAAGGEGMVWRQRAGSLGAAAPPTGAALPVGAAAHSQTGA